MSKRPLSPTSMQLRCCRSRTRVMTSVSGTTVAGIRAWRSRIGSSAMLGVGIVLACASVPVVAAHAAYSIEVGAGAAHAVPGATGRVGIPDVEPAMNRANRVGMVAGLTATVGLAPESSSGRASADRTPGTGLASGSLARPKSSGTAGQTIVFGGSPVLVAGGSAALSATASSGLPVAFSSITPSTCAISGTFAIGLASGICTVAADQAGDPFYGAAPTVLKSFVVTAATSTTTMYSAAGTTYLGQGVTFVTTVTGSTPTGSVTFLADGAPIAGCNAVPLVLNGNAHTAVCNTTSLPIRHSSITASYSGDAANFASVSLPVVHTVLGLAWRRDFDGDGRADILWRNPQDGQVSLAKMAGGTIRDVVAIGGDLNWTVVGDGDFNADGYADLVWRHSDGTTQLKLMQDGNVLSTKVLSSDPNWSVAAIADLDGDGRADLVWRHVSGVTIAWLMNGATSAAAAGLGSDPNWSIAATGDFDGNGKFDLVWRHSSGTTILWLMDGLRSVGAAGLGADPNWSIAACGDFDGDGRSDLVWRKNAGAGAGTNVMWRMYGGIAVGALGLGSDPSFTIAAVGDYDGNGREDLVWRQDSGWEIMWLMSGSGPVAAFPLGLRVITYP